MSTSATILPAVSITADDDWKRNRRSSAIIFGTDFSDDLSVEQNESLPVINGHQKDRFTHMNRSSDDLLLASRSNHTSGPIVKGIYENFRSASSRQSKVNNGIREDRKLTKDSGYESASTLVNLGTVQTGNGQVLTQKLPQNGFFLGKNSTSGIQPHSRSDSIDSNNSIDLYHSVETRT